MTALSTRTYGTDASATTIPHQPVGARKSWRRIVTAVDPDRRDAYALSGPWLDADAAYALTVGTLIMSCDVYTGHREIALHRVGPEGLEQIKTWTLKKPLGRAVLNFTARRITVTSETALRLDEPPPRPNLYPGRCRRCRRAVAAGAGLVTGHQGARQTEHPGECPPPAAVITPNRFGGACKTCDMWVEAESGVAVRITAPDAHKSEYAPRHVSPCPPDADPGPRSRRPGWCRDCGEYTAPGQGWLFNGELHHRGPCPPTTHDGQAWTVPVRYWMGRWHPGQVVHAQVDLRYGGEFPHSDTPGLRVLAPTYVEFAAAVLDVVDTGLDRRSARIRAATGDEAAPLLARQALAALDARPSASTFKSRLIVKRTTPHGLELRMRFDTLGRHRPWLAEITGRDPDYRWQREFLTADIDWRHADKKGRGLLYCWTLACDRVYQMHHLDAGGDRQVRSYLRSTPDGDIVRITAEEVHAWLNSAPAWPDH